MSKITYPWKRFWCPRDGMINLGNDGFLVDPDSKWGHIQNPDLVAYHSIEDTPCLILLGEPGIGKSSSMFSDKEAVDKRIAERGERSFWIDLRSFGSEERIIKNIFESGIFRNWVDNKYRLHLFIDSFDECLLRVDTLASLIAYELSKYPLERLFLRILCRTAESDSIDLFLRKLYKDEEFKAFELAPLKRSDVIEAAKCNSINPESFLEEITLKEAVPLAIKPITLEFLIRTYKTEHHLPNKQSDLYYEGCLLLCTEINESRRTARKLGLLNPGKRLQIASRIAALTIFSKKNAIWWGSPFGDFTAEEDLTFDDIINSDEIIDGIKLELSYDLLHEVLDTGLFSSRGIDRLGWAHQTYAEFLAASYLVKHNLASSQIINLLVHPLDKEGKLIPQLCETAAWIAGMRPDIFSEIMRIEPETLLRSDVASIDVDIKKILVENLLNMVAEEKIQYRNLSSINYRKLSHPKLADQLRQIINDKIRHQAERNVAIDISEVCNVKELQNDLITIVIDPTEVIHLRVNAASAISRFADSEIKCELKNVLMGDLTEDTDDQLKGICLRVLWPNYLSADELFSMLTPPKRENLLGQYFSFIVQDIGKHLDKKDLFVALKWVVEQKARHKVPQCFGSLINMIMILAWQYIEGDGIIEAFATAVLSRLRHFDEIITDKEIGCPELNPPFYDQLQNKDETRRNIIDKIIHLLSDPKESSKLIFHTRSIVVKKDFMWLIKKIENCPSQKEKEILSNLIWDIFNINDSTHVNAILESCQKELILAERFTYFINPVELGSPFAIKSKNDFEETQKWQEKNNKQTQIEPSPKEIVETLLKSCESGNLQAWWRLNREMTLGPHSTHYGDELQADLTKLPGWQYSDSGTRNRIVACAKRYIAGHVPDPEKWLSKDIIYFPDFAGYRALILVMKEDSDYILSMQSSEWKRWAAVILGYPISHLGTEEEIHDNIITLAYPHAQDEIIKTLLLLIDKENRTGDYIFITRRIHKCWDEKIASSLYDKLQDENLKPGCFQGILLTLLDHHYGKAVEYAESLLSLPIPIEKRVQARVVAECLIMKVENINWPLIWQVMQGDIELGKEIFLNVAHNYDDRNASSIKNLSEKELADLYIWLEGNFPHAENPVEEGAHIVSSRESIMDWRSGVLVHLRNKGTNQTIDEIEGLKTELPHLHFLQNVLLTAKEQTRRLTWRGTTPRDIIKLTNNPELRLVQNGEQLLEIIIDSLKKLEKQLHGDPLRVQFLWDNLSDGSVKPKDENSLSDYVKGFLDDELVSKGIILNREVQIRRGIGNLRGECTDIHVDTITQELDKISVIIEVKMCRHRELYTAMETQLIERYLKNNRCQYGLYLVGWYNWKGCPVRPIEDMQREFEKQASRLSTDGRVVKSLVIDVAINKTTTQPLD